MQGILLLKPRLMTGHDITSQPRALFGLTGRGGSTAVWRLYVNIKSNAHNPIKIVVIINYTYCGTTEKRSSVSRRTLKTQCFLFVCCLIWLGCFSPFSCPRVRFPSALERGFFWPLTGIIVLSLSSLVRHTFLFLRVRTIEAFPGDKSFIVIFRPDRWCCRVLCFEKTQYLNHLYEL